MTSRGPTTATARASPPNAPHPVPFPRRASPNTSVSLKHHRQPRQPSRLHKVSSPDSEDADADAQQLQEDPTNAESGASTSPSSLQAVGAKGSSGESSNAERWFEQSNNQVRDSSAPFADNDPPFFLRNNSSSSETPPDRRLGVDSLPRRDAAESLPLRTGLLHIGTDGSSTEDFRSVIDDLTIANKKLKRRLKKYEKLHDSHLKDEKLFEVRIHGLPAERKRELEETLRKFALSLGPAGTTAFPSNGYASLATGLKTGKDSSSHTSHQNTDSAYASMSASGQSGNDQRSTPNQYPAARTQNIHNYLHHIPEGLLPQQNPASMTEKAKKKMVVRRLEHLFAGKGAASGGHLHSMQQQEVSQSAARIDRSAMEESDQRARYEGAREAYIMDDEGKDQGVEGGGVGRKGLSEQRPTRPLDLDPHRAQVPAENIRYMRQMGFSPRDPGSEELAEGHGWIYLNFLINMAQLHTINVTADFVRKAISDYSNKFEVSLDGRKVRWRGGDSVTRCSSSAGDSSHRTSNDTPDAQSPRKRQKLSHGDDRSGGQPSGGSSARLRQESTKYAYTPLFFHRANSDEAEDSSSEEDDDDVSLPSLPPALFAGDSSGMTSSGIRTNYGVPGPTGKKRPKHDDGPIIFYNNARFCTDLSGDRRTTPNHAIPSYTMASSIPIGPPLHGTAGGVIEKRGPLADASELPEPMDLGDNPIPESMELTFPARSPPQSHQSSSTAQMPLDLEVTGIGGVWPADHFSISVESRNTVVVQQQPARPVLSMVPGRFTKILQDSESLGITTPRLQKQVVASKVQTLPPSRLPEALNFMAFGEDSEGENDFDGDDESEAPDSLDAPPPATAPQPVDMHYASMSEDEESDDDEDDDDDMEESDGEIDFLATARAAEPEMVRQQEREYEANMAERLAEEIPTGSSAATAGGGSGFASPADGVDRTEYRRAIQEARAKAKLAKATESMTASHKQTSSRDNDSNGEEQLSDVPSEI
ncbi:frequency clock protein [Neohortaea acidophila]|uniref:Frequency clock protein n=1 Tax=Neohortaea acidophila TaxID=245834 RepID=A0A6A6Q4Q9_9PEZI|nr:frequency clock protein [Neohortaea acidophila]KAF2486984.1 frequency clock protein [Neohortaea acidophila]